MHPILASAGSLVVVERLIRLRGRLQQDLSKRNGLKRAKSTIFRMFLCTILFIPLFFRLEESNSHNHLLIKVADKIVGIVHIYNNEPTLSFLSRFEFDRK